MNSTFLMACMILDIISKASMILESCLNFSLYDSLFYSCGHWLVGKTQINILMLTIKDKFSESVQILIYFYLLKQILFPLWRQKAIQIHVFRNGSNIPDADKKSEGLLVAFLELYTVFYLNYFTDINKLINITLVLHSLLAVLTKRTLSFNKSSRVGLRMAKLFYFFFLAHRC